jgi:hypothetical protein
MAAALMLCGVLLVLSPSAKASAYVDTTPYGLVFASGTVTGDGSGEAGADYQFYTSPKGQQRKVNVAFFRPPTGVATNPFTTGWLPGSCQIYNPDGSLLINATNVTASLVYFPFFYSGTPMGIVMFETTYRGVQSLVIVSIIPNGSAARIQVSVMTKTDPANPNNYTHVAFYHAGALTGVDIIDP